MAALGFELLLRFLWGSLILLFFISRNETSERFLKLALYIAIGCSIATAALGWASLEGDKSLELLKNPLIMLLALVVFFAVYTFGRSRTSRIIGFIGVFISPIPLFLNFDIAKFINFVSSALLIGSVFSGQFLGHWYLNVPNLNIRELRRLVSILQFSILFKTLENLWTLFFKIGYNVSALPIDDLGRPLGIDLSHIQNLETLHMSDGIFSLQGDLAFGMGGFGLIILLTRVLWGILAPLILANMVKRTVEIRATQSATGILYALCVMIIVGEGSAIYLKLTLNYLL